MFCDGMTSAADSAWTLEGCGRGGRRLPSGFDRSRVITKTRRSTKATISLLFFSLLRNVFVLFVLLRAFVKSRHAAPARVACEVCAEAAADDRCAGDRTTVDSRGDGSVGELSRRRT